ncbi:MAG TPA: glycosyltransferase family 1 protein [Candidatus Moranbacteria bacterium]|nr:glycosyltransferase family 1 protein [Candidatus Moranbacteria bacterium]HSA08163.1 glycosyltransferase family 1 protein [Candidatus Moranbacteria bacterium]
MARIGIDIRLIGKKRTGDEVVIFNLVKNMAQMDADNEFELFTDIADEKILKEISEQLGITGKNNFKIVSLPAKNKFTWNLWTLPKYLRQNPVDVYHTQYITPWFVPKKIKIVTIVHDISFNFFPQFIKFSDLFFLKALIPISLKRSDKIVGVSQFTRDEIIKFYNINPEKVDYIYDAVGDEFLSPPAGEEVSEEKIAEVRKKYDLPEKFILYMGTLQPRKNIPQLIDAYAATKNKLGGIKLVICGNRQAYNFDKKIDEAVAKNNLSEEVFFPGYIDEKDKRLVFAAAQAFIFPSLYEGFGIPVLEAMSQKVPVLASDIPSLKEIAGQGALYFDTTSVADFSQKLYDICVNNDLRAQLIQSGMARINFFSWKNSAQKMLAIYRKL